MAADGLKSTNRGEAEHDVHLGAVDICWPLRRRQDAQGGAALGAGVTSGWSIKRRPRSSQGVSSAWGDGESNRRAHQPAA